MVGLPTARRDFRVRLTDLDETKARELAFNGGNYPPEEHWRLLRLALNEITILREDRAAAGSARYPLAQRAQVVARTVFAKDWEALAHTARVVANLGPDARDEEQAVAWLHDVIEDTQLELVDLVDLAFPYQVIQAVKVLSRVPGSDYEAYKHWLLHAPDVYGAIARKVKLADARENLDRCERAVGVPKWQRLADERYRPLIAQLEVQADA